MTPLRNSRISHAPCFAKFNLVKITFRLDNKLIKFYFTESTLGSTICPVSEIVCFPVLNFTYSHAENSLFFALD
jgi:hypothetical protein